MTRWLASPKQGLPMSTWASRTATTKASPNMNKRMKASAHLEAAQVLRSLDMSFDFGFMLLEPYSTTRDRPQQHRVSRSYVGDGWTVAGFCRTLPSRYALKAQLEAEGRMLGTPFEPDYNFLDPKLDPSMTGCC